MSPADLPADGPQALVWERVTPSVRAGRRYPLTSEPDGSVKIGPMIEPAVIEWIEVFARDGTLLYAAALDKAIADGDVILVTPRP